MIPDRRAMAIIYKTAPLRNEIIWSGREARKGSVCAESGQIPCWLQLADQV